MGRRRADRAARRHAGRSHRHRAHADDRCQPCRSSRPRWRCRFPPARAARRNHRASEIATIERASARRHHSAPEQSAGTQMLPTRHEIRRDWIDARALPGPSGFPTPSVLVRITPAIKALIIANVWSSSSLFFQPILCSGSAMQPAAVGDKRRVWRARDVHVRAQPVARPPPLQHADALSWASSWSGCGARGIFAKFYFACGIGAA